MPKLHKFYTNINFTAPICKRNEVYNACANGGCEMRKCSELTKPINCTEPEECIGDCVCVEGYLRDDNGVCAPIHECHRKKTYYYYI